MHNPDREKWISSVTCLLARDWHIDAADAGLSDDDLIRHWQEGGEPSDFVRWFAEKYDLIRFETAM